MALKPTLFTHAIQPDHFTGKILGEEKEDVFKGAYH